jgi:hypothetical protein
MRIAAILLVLLSSCSSGRFYSGVCKERTVDCMIRLQAKRITSFAAVDWPTKENPNEKPPYHSQCVTYENNEWVFWSSFNNDCYESTMDEQFDLPLEQLTFVPFCEFVDQMYSCRSCDISKP